MNRLGPERAEQMRIRRLLHPRSHPVRWEPTPIKYAPWWSPWRAYILLAAWLFFGKRHLFRELCLVMLGLLLFSVWAASLQPEADLGYFIYCIVQRNTCVR